MRRSVLDVRLSSVERRCASLQARRPRACVLRDRPVALRKLDGGLSVTTAMCVYSFCRHALLRMRCACSVPSFVPMHGVTKDTRTVWLDMQASITGGHALRHMFIFHRCADTCGNKAHARGARAATGSEAARAHGGAATFHECEVTRKCMRSCCPYALRQLPCKDIGRASLPCRIWQEYRHGLI